MHVSELITQSIVLDAILIHVGSCRPVMPLIRGVVLHCDRVDSIQNLNIDSLIERCKFSQTKSLRGLLSLFVHLIFINELIRRSLIWPPCFVIRFGSDFLESL